MIKVIIHSTNGSHSFSIDMAYGAVQDAIRNAEADGAFCFSGLNEDEDRICVRVNMANVVSIGILELPAKDPSPSPVGG